MLAETGLLHKTVVAWRTVSASHGRNIFEGLGNRILQRYGESLEPASDWCCVALAGRFLSEPDVGRAFSAWQRHVASQGMQRTMDIAEKHLGRNALFVMDANVLSFGVAVRFFGHGGPQSA